VRRRYRPKKAKEDSVKKLRVNQQIRAPKIIVIDENGENLGEMTVSEGIERAKEREFDLVEVHPNAEPPVCKLTDFGKLQYKRAKQMRQNKANQKKVETKGVRLGLRTETHDLNFKRKQAEKFLKKGNKVKVELLLRGREKAHGDIAKENIRAFIDSIDIPHKIEEDVKRFPQGFHVLIAPE
jgi:translation initiation factor IF-3